ncbi:MAG: hypothetical protein LUF82_07405 [Clostridia bacterium]|nr:hypothetical protein [Clostridia bacterium]
MKKIFNNLSHSNLMVKNGYATLCDKVFIGDFNFESDYLIPVIKASTGKQSKIFYPYDKNGQLIPENEMEKDKNIYSYLTKNKAALQKRSNEKDDYNYWYAFGRSQAINDTYKNKLAINALIRNSNDLKIIDAPPGTGVYGGLYIISDTIDFNTIKKALYDEEFATYISLLGKYKSGGYYTFSSKDVKAYLDYKLSFDMGLLYDD